MGSAFTELDLAALNPRHPPSNFAPTPTVSTGATLSPLKRDRGGPTFVLKATRSFWTHPADKHNQRRLRASQLRQACPHTEIDHTNGGREVTLPEWRIRARAPAPEASSIPREPQKHPRGRVKFAQKAIADKVSDVETKGEA